MRNLCTVAICLIVTACATELPSRRTVGELATALVTTEGGSEFVFCDPAVGAWRCPARTPKTPAQDSTAGVAVRSEGDFSHAKKTSSTSYPITTEPSETRHSTPPLPAGASPSPQADSSTSPFSAVVYFATGSAWLNPQSIRTLQDVTPEGRRLVLAGFTDNTGTDQVNQLLALRRAEVVRDFLLQRGWRQEDMEIAGNPQCCYADTNDTKEGRAKNRRTELKFTE